MKQVLRPARYKVREDTLKKLLDFKPAFEAMVNNARAHFGVLDTDAACDLDLLPEYDDISYFDLLKRIKKTWGKPAIFVFHEYFGEAKKVPNKSRLKRLWQEWRAGEITKEQFMRRRGSCFTWRWTLRAQYLLPPDQRV